MEPQTSADLAWHIQDFREHGFTVFSQLFAREHVEQIRDRYPIWQEEARLITGTKPPVITNLLERDPALVLPCVAHPTLLDFLEGVIGPFVQLDSTVLAGFAPLDSPPESRVTCWHRDRFALFPKDNVYIRPNTLLCLCYLQEMTDAIGPLRVIPGSHRTAITLDEAQAYAPHPDERLLHLQPGDLVILHNTVLHSGTLNISRQLRLFFGLAYDHTYMRQQDTFSGPNCQDLLARAKACHDRRLQRLLGYDEKLEDRLNTGFLHSEEEHWASWQEEDRELLGRQDR